MLRAARERRGLVAIAIVVGVAGSAAPARAEDVKPAGREVKVEAPSVEAREEADRVFLGGDAPGSLGKPLPLADEAALAKVCEALQGPRRAPRESEAYQAPTKKALREAQRLALRSVYRVMVPPGGFQAAPYRPEQGVLPLRVDRGLIAVDGALTLQVMKKKGAELELTPEVAKVVARAIEEKKVALELTFRPEAEAAEQLSPCFSPAKSAAYVLRVEPIDYALVEVASAKRLAKASTPMRQELERFVQPGPAALATSVQVDGGLDPDALTRALDARRADLTTCLQPIMASRGGTGVVGYGASVLPSGALDDVRLEVDALESPDASACVGKVIAGLSVPKGARASRAHLTVSIERVAPDGKEPEVVRGAVN